MESSILIGRTRMTFHPLDSVVKGRRLSEFELGEVAAPLKDGKVWEGGPVVQDNSTGRRAIVRLGRWFDSSWHDEPVYYLKSDLDASGKPKAVEVRKPINLLNDGEAFIYDGDGKPYYALKDPGPNCRHCSSLHDYGVKAFGWGHVVRVIGRVSFVEES